MTLAVWQNSEKVVRGPFQNISVDRNAITMLPSGGYVVSWREGGDFKFQIFDGLGAPLSANPYTIAATSENQNSASIQTIGNDGTFVVTWNQSIPNQTDKFSIHTQVFNFDGTPKTEAVKIAEGLTIDQLDVPVIGRMQDGGYVTVHDAGNSIHYTRFDANGVKGATVQVAQGVDIQYADVVDLGNGRFIVSYYDKPAQGNTGIRFKIIDPNNAVPETGIWVAEGMYSDVTTFKNSAGETCFAVIYNTGASVQAKLFNANGSAIGTGAPIALSDLGLNQLDFVDAVGLRGGRVAVLMSEKVRDGEQTVDNGDIFLKIINADGTIVSIPTPLNSRSTRDSSGQQFTPTISEMEDGRLAIAWHDPTLGGGIVSTIIVDPRIAAVTTAGTIRNDIYVGSEHAGDVLAAYLGNDTLVGSLGADVMHGGGDIDTMSYQYALEGVTFVLQDGGPGGTSGDEAEGDVYTGLENAIGSAFNDRITGSDQANKLEGGLGNDTLDGATGIDNMLGGAGNDVYYVDETADIANETNSSGGIDLVYSTASYTLDDLVENLTLTGEGPINGTGNALANRITGNLGSNTLTGNAGNDILNGGLGADILVGGIGNDIFYVDRATDKITETSSGGTDTLYASVSYTLSSTSYVESMATTSSSSTATINLRGNNIAQTIAGNAGTNTLSGLGGNDNINGGSGSDRIYGGSGSDVLYGGGRDAKRDTFVFDTALSARSNVDSIRDFSTAYDRIELDNDVFGRAGPVGRLSSDAFVTASRAQDREDRIIYDRANGALYYDADGTGSAAAIKFAQLARGLAMSYTDFYVIN